MVAYVVVDQTEIDVREELSSNISDLLVLAVILDSIFEVLRFTLTELHVVNSNAIVGQCFSMDIPNSLAHLEEPLVLLYGSFVLAKVVKEYPSAVVSSTFIS